MTAAAVAPDVAIGDTFQRVGDGGGPWEVTAQASDKVWNLRCGGLICAAHEESILDPARWGRVRAM